MKSLFLTREKALKECGRFIMILFSPHGRELE